MKRIGIFLIIAVLVLFLSSAAAAKENPIKNKSDQTTLLNETTSVSIPELGFILNNSSTTICPEEDNINMPLYYKNITAYRIIATHPAYLLTEMIDKGKNCTNCPNYVNFTTKAQKIYDDKDVIIETVVETPWWRQGHGMNVSIKGAESNLNVTYLRIYKLIDNTYWDYPQIFVLYEDGNARIIPQPPINMKNVTFGSSVILGATEKQKRHFVDIDSVDIDPINLTMEILYKDKTMSHVGLKVDRSHNTVEVSNITYDTTNHPFARFRSMWVKDGNADIDHIRTQDGIYPIMVTPTKLNGTWWKFSKEFPSIHNTYCPDIKIEVITQNPTLQHINGTQ
jgi:hypothetical protein